MTDAPTIDLEPDLGVEQLPIRAVGNCSLAPIYLRGHGILDPGTDPVDVPDTPQVREMLGTGVLWTHEQESPEADGNSPAAQTTPKKAASRTRKEETPS